MSAKPSKQMLREVVAHYERQLARHGPSAEGMDWKDATSQVLRFEVLCGICDLSGLCVHDVGAGAGHFADYLEARGVVADYSGSDLSQQMVASARARHPQLSFECRDLLEAPLPRDSVDVAICSGLFHVKLEHSEGAWWRFVQQMLGRMFEMSRVGIAFNLMSDAVDYRSPKLFYAEPGPVLDFCRRELGRRVVLRHDYPLYEYTVYVYRDDADI